MGKFSAFYSRHGRRAERVGHERWLLWKIGLFHRETGLKAACSAAFTPPVTRKRKKRRNSCLFWTRQRQVPSPKRRTCPVVACKPKHCTVRQGGVPREVQRGHGFGARERDNAMPPLVVSFGHFLSTQEMAPPEAPIDEESTDFKRTSQQKIYLIRTGRII